MTPGIIHDSQILNLLVEEFSEKIGKSTAVAADAFYKTPAIAIYLIDNEMTPALPYT